MTVEFTSPSAAIDAIGFGRFQWLLLFYTGLGWFADACETMLLSFLGPAVRCQWPHISAGAESILTSVVFVGMLVGVNGLGALADALGRRRGFLVSACLLGTAGLASAMAPSFPWLLLFRGLVGIGLGGTPVIVTIFSEFVPSPVRGRWMLIMQSWWTLGIMFEACLAWLVLGSLEMSWRWLLALSATPLFLLFLFYHWLPESPHWLVVQGRYREAEAVVLQVATVNNYGRHMLLNFAADKEQQAALHQEQQQQQQGDRAINGDGSSSPRAADRAGREGRRLEQAAGGAARRHASPGRPNRRRLAGATGALAAEPGEDGSGSGSAAAAAAVEEGGQAALEGLLGQEPSDVGAKGAAGASEMQRLVAGVQAAFGRIFGPRLLRSTLLLYVIWFVNALTYYGLVLLTTALQTASKEHNCTLDGRPNLTNSDFSAVLVTSFAEAPALVAAAIMVDWCGRRWTLRSLLLCCAGCAMLLAATPNGGYGWQLLLLFMARAGIEGSFCALYVYTPELYPTAVRTFGLALCNAFSRIGGFLAPFATVYLVQQQAPQASELLLGTLCLLAAGASFLLPYETKGLDLHQLDVLDGPEGQHGQHRQQQQQREGAAAAAAGGLGGGGGGKQRGGGGRMLSAVDGADERGFGDGAEREERDPLLAL